MIDPSHPAADATARSALETLPETLAAIDIGTNSIHMVVARVIGDGRFEVITRHKEVVRLGEGGDVQLKTLSDAAMDRGIAALRRCRAILDRYGSPVAALATSAVREAENRAEFIRRAAAEAGIDVEVISGHEEARLIYLGVLQALPVYETPLILCDIGGGSTEVLIGNRGEVLASRSFKLGAIRLSRRIFPDGNTSPRSMGDARRLVQMTLASFGREVAHLPKEVAIGSSGTIENLAAMIVARRGDDLQSLNGVSFTRLELAALMSDLEAAGSTSARSELRGIDKSRSDIIMGGAVVLEQVMAVFGIAEMTVSEDALREGALFDLAERFRAASTDHLSDLRRRSIDHLMQVCDDDPDHSWQVARLSLQLFDGLGEMLELTHFDRDILEAAALLANVGLIVAHSRHHQHSYYVIRNSEHLAGFTDREIELIAQVARYHRRSAPTTRHAPFAALDAADRTRVRSLAAILRIAIGLDRSHAGLVDSVDGSVGDTLAIIGHAKDGADIELEVFAASERTGLLAEVSGRDVVVSAGAPPS